MLLVPQQVYELRTFSVLKGDITISNQEMALVYVKCKVTPLSLELIHNLAYLQISETWTCTADVQKRVGVTSVSNDGS
jgi:hypothetical protein